MPGSPGRVPVPIICTRLSTGPRIFPSQAPILLGPEGTRLPEENDSEAPEPWTRRGFVKLRLAAGGAAGAARPWGRLARPPLQGPGPHGPPPRSPHLRTPISTDVA